MGMEDRDWYREKKIDWNRGGLRDRAPKTRFPKFAWWVLGAVILIVAVALLRPM